MSPDETTHENRKLEHLRINLQENVQYRQSNGLERYRFVHQALPEINQNEISLATEFFGKKLRAPILISSMTGGAYEAERINLALASAAQATGIAMGLGSQRAAIENESLAYTYQVRRVAPDILLFANLGAIQLNYAYSIDECRRAVQMIHADALILHLNAMQEAVQAGGNTNWKGLLKKIEQVCRVLDVPVIGKEVGFGISEDAARQLASAGVAALDIAGAGGTSWAAVEAYRAPSAFLRELAEAFWDWGIPTAESIVQARRGAPNLPIIASGGIRDGVEAAKCIALGAGLVGFASPLLRLADRGAEDVIAGIKMIEEQMRTAMFGIGAENVDALRNTQHLIGGQW
ncbi:MAG: type 2 isopentenyl-diphosphate Delta-isomerase [Anaerolineales bacterium]|nr:type 2 isopentenyl-diphosphate Delta-isomerase [Anaerolineales bacterium]